MLGRGCCLVNGTLVLYEMATGALPFRGESSGVIFNAILERVPAPAVRFNPEVSAELERIVNKALEKDRNLRYQHASEMRSDLQRLKRDTNSPRVTVSAKATAATAVRLRRKLMVPVAVAVLTLSVGSYFYFHRTPKLTDKDTIVLADLTNMTGDTVFDGTLRQGLSVQLEQSPFPPTLLGPGSRHCHGINYTHPMKRDPMKRDVKEKIFSPPL